MKRSGFKQTRAAPMPRKRAKPRRVAAPEENQPNIAPKVRKALKSRPARPKMTPARKSAKGQDCTLQLPGCRNDTETVVLCHLRMFGGGGTGYKPPDGEAVYACHYCHDRLDMREGATIYDRSGEPIDRWEFIAFALIRTHRIMRDEGILIMKGEE